MGLDMYLEGRLFCSEYSEDKQKVDRLLEAVRKEFGPFEEVSGNYKHLTINVPLMYWRKANAIHKWFVDNCQEGVDECQKAYVSREQLEQLLALIEEIQAAKHSIDQTKVKALIEEKLPPCEGFFFGSTDVDEFYFMDIDETQAALKCILAMPVQFDGYNYHSSW